MSLWNRPFFLFLMLFLIVLAFSTCSKESELPQEPQSVYQYSDSITAEIDSIPNTGVFTIFFDQAYQKVEIEISNIQGKILFSDVLINSNQIELNTNLDNGVYFIKLTSQSNYSTTLKLVIKK